MYLGVRSGQHESVFGLPLSERMALFGRPKAEKEPWTDSEKNSFAELQKPSVSLPGLEWMGQTGLRTAVKEPVRNNFAVPPLAQNSVGFERPWVREPGLTETVEKRRAEREPVREPGLKPVDDSVRRLARSY